MPWFWGLPCTRIGCLTGKHSVSGGVAALMMACLIGKWGWYSQDQIVELCLFCTKNNVTLRVRPRSPAFTKKALVGVLSAYKGLEKNRTWWDVHILLSFASFLLRTFSSFMQRKKRIRKFDSVLQNFIEHLLCFEHHAPASPERIPTKGLRSAKVLWWKYV